MTTESAVTNVEAYVMMLESGCPTKKARSRYLKSLGYLKSTANYMKYGHYKEYGKIEDENKAKEEEKGADVTPLSEILKASRKGIREGARIFI